LRLQAGGFFVSFAGDSACIPSARKKSLLKLASLSDAELLKIRLCDLPIELPGSVVEKRAHQVFEELAARNLTSSPSIWLSEEWFNPDGIVGFAIPFYLLHPRLIRLERKIMQEAEGATKADCLRIMRHETGHAIDEAFQLFKTPEYRRVFGSALRRYPTTYSAKPDRHDFVTNLNSWYAQAHPVEDFAETFAVWLTPKQAWRRRYRRSPALEKLEHVDRWMTALAGKLPIVNARDSVEELKENPRTLREHYDEKRAFYGIEETRSFDSELRRLFPAVSSGNHKPTSGRRSRSASRVLQAERAKLRKQVSRPLGIPAYAVDQVLLQLISRSRSLNLRVTESSAKVHDELAELVTRLTIDAIQNGQKLPL
jgi:hypothetical protein